MNPNILVKYVNKWVALSSDRKRVIVAAQNLLALDRKVRKLPGKVDVIYHHVLPINGSYVP